MSFLNEERDYNTLTKRVNELYQQGKLDEAIELSKQAINLARKIWGNLHPDIAWNLNNLAYFYSSLGKYREAETLYQEALIISQRLFTKDHFYIATTLDNLATVYLAQGKYQQAESLFHKALAIRQRLYPQDHSDIATSLNNLAVLYRSLARYKEAESFFQKALAMLKRLFPQDHPEVAAMLNNLGFFYYKQGRYSQAEPLYQEALAMRQRLYSTNNPDVNFTLNKLGLFTLNNLGLVYFNQGKYAQAEHIFKDVLNVCKQNFKNEYLIVRILVNLSNIYFKINNYNASEPFLQEAFAMTKNFTDNYPDVALVLNQLAYLYHLQGKYIESETLYKKCLRIYENLFPLEHPDIAQILNNLACLYDSQKNYSEAEVLNQKALMIYQRLFPQGYPKILDSLINLAYIYINTYRNPLALHFFQEATEVEHRFMSQEFVGSSENDRMRFLNQIRDTQYNLLSLVYQYYYPLEESQEKSNAIHIALDIVLKRKALSNAASAAISAAIYSNRYPENIQAAFQQWRSLWQQIVNLQSSLYLPENLPRLEANKNLLNDLHQQVEKLEKDITREVPEIRLENQLVDRETIAKELPENSTLIEFVYFNVYNFVNREWEKARYVAFILPAKQPDKVQMFDLGEADKIDELISKVREAVTKLKLEDMGISVGDFNSPVTTPENLLLELSLENLLVKLSNTIVKPLENYLQGEQLFICPDNALTLIPFDILPLNAEDNQLLIDKYNITYLTAARDLLRYKYNPNRPASESLVIADPNFDLSVDGSPTIPNNEESSTSSKIYIKEEGLSINLDSLATEIIEGLDNENEKRFPPVPQTAEIAKVAATQLNVLPLLQNQALKSYLTNGKCPEILVLATHGFFLPQKFVPTNPSITEELGEKSLLRFQQMQTTENPLFRSGFALAGANTWLLGGEIPPEAGEGIVFAQDVAGFDLWANKIILLIACLTAVGDVTAGEGVKGLRSAFTAAGARLLIMSLWSVPVKPSILLMNRFFENMDNRKLSAQIALKEAQNYIRTMTRDELQSLAIGKEILQELQLQIEPVLQKNPELAKTWKMSEYPLQHRYFWGAWVCVGRELR